MKAFNVILRVLVRRYKKLQLTTVDCASARRQFISFDYRAYVLHTPFHAVSFYLTLLTFVHRFFLCGLLIMCSYVYKYMSVCPIILIEKIRVVVKTHDKQTRAEKKTLIQL